MRNKCITDNQCHYKWGNDCASFQQIISNYRHEKEQNHPLLRRMRIQDHHVVLRDNARKKIF